MDWVASFYRFYAVDDVPGLRDEVERACNRHSLAGTVLIAREGVNATLAGAKANLQRLLGHCFPELPDTAVKWSPAPPERPAFHRLKVRAKPEIVTFGRALTASAALGERVGVDAWLRLLDNPDVTILDVRNNYETSVGAFRGALRPNIGNFREFASFAERELKPGRGAVGMYCTGGIRCEKASALLLERGFDAVYQLHGGILRFLQDTNGSAGEGRSTCQSQALAKPNAPAPTATANARRNAFEGECFVFDGRVSLNAQLQPGSYRLCSTCGWPLATATAAVCRNRCCRAARCATARKASSADA